ncbi:DUF2909 family protein [Arsukibacterium sp.]|uniref:DUF2909 family protein n=1 Tax=Arsukibacterium sp. TaxID=1977258 RepID=UPI002FDB0B55
MLIKLVIIALLLFMLFNLFKAGVIMLRNDSGQNTSRHLGRRVLYAGLALGLIILAILLGLVTPNPRPY